MEYYSKEISSLIGELSRLPGIGSKSAQRLAFHILHMPKEDVQRLSHTLMDARENVHYCKECCTLTDQDICPICGNPKRNHKEIMVVEESHIVPNGTIFHLLWNGQCHMVITIRSPLTELTQMETMNHPIASGQPKLNNATTEEAVLNLLLMVKHCQFLNGQENCTFQGVLCGAESRNTICQSNKHLPCLSVHQEEKITLKN